MFFFFKQKIVFGFLLSVFSFSCIYSMGKSDYSIKKVPHKAAQAVYDKVVESIQNSNDQGKAAYLQAVKDKKDRLLQSFESKISDALDLDITSLSKDGSSFKDFAKTFIDKIVASFDSIELTMPSPSSSSSSSSSSSAVSSSNPTMKLSRMVQLDSSDKFFLAFSLIQEIKEALKPSGLVRLDKAKLKIACKKCGEVTCVCCVCVTCAGVTCLHPEIVANFVQNFPKISICCAGTATACAVDKRCCGGYFLKAISEIFKNIFSGVKCRCCNCCNDNDKDLNV